MKHLSFIPLGNLLSKQWRCVSERDVYVLADLTCFRLGEASENNKLGIQSGAGSILTALFICDKFSRNNGFILFGPL